MTILCVPLDTKRAQMPKTVTVYTAHETINNKL